MIKKIKEIIIYRFYVLIILFCGAIFIRCSYDYVIMIECILLLAISILQYHMLKGQHPENPSPNRATIDDKESIRDDSLE
jgi:hypothetical protein